MNPESHEPPPADENRILELQRQDRYFQMAVAKDHLYLAEERWLSIWLAASLAIAIIGAITIPQDLLPLMGVAALALVIAELSIIPWINRRRQTAAAIQELYDVELFGLTWNAFLGEPPSQEVIAENYQRRRDKISPEREQGLRDWYTSQAAGGPLYQARIVCQWQNAWWTHKLRKRYTRDLYVATTLAALLVIGVGAYWQWTPAEILLFVPAISIGYMHAAAQRKSVKRLDAMLPAIRKLWTQSNADSPDLDKIELETRNLQNEVYHIRDQSPFIPDWYFKSFRNNFEQLSNTPAIYTVEHPPS